MSTSTPENQPEQAESITLYDAVGGMPFFEALVEKFYAGVAHDDVLAPLYPEAPDFTGARHRLTLFLAQYWGGPTTYNDERGHPKLRMRHFPYPVGPLQRDRWLQHMSAAVRSLDIDPALQTTMLDYFVTAAEHLRNDTGLPITSASYPRQ